MFGQTKMSEGRTLKASERKEVRYKRWSVSKNIGIREIIDRFNF